MPRTKMKIEVSDVAKSNGKKKSLLKSASTPNQRFKALDPIPESAASDPVGWAEDHHASLIPYASKEVEYQLKFGDDKTRREMALHILSTKGITKKVDQANQVVPAIQVIMTGPAPFTQLTVTNQPTKQLVEGEVVGAKNDKR